MAEIVEHNKFSINLKQADEAMSLKTWWALIFIYPLARRLTVYIVNHTRITPNQITFCAIGLRIVTAVCFFSGSRVGLIIGAITYYLAYVCDCSDGTVARIRSQASELGRYLDHVSDLIGDILILIALAWSQGMVLSAMILGMVFMHVAECYMSYLTGFALRSEKTEGSSFLLFSLVNRYRRWWFARNIKSFFSFPDYNAMVFVLFPLIGMPTEGLQLGFFFLFFICLYTVFSSFVSIHSGESCFP